ncbi:response regulator transcription factor [Herbiconiux sp. P17]|uniref:response regulator transcription factor n=1 Tax=Herbiconiux wuyangfengii TaxID=3342794 RepID=UPI0035B92063
MALSVMVVDDDDRFRGLAKRLLAGCGYRFEGEASSVSDALHLTARHTADVVLVDIDLPDGDGLELSRQLTAPPSTTRVVLVSADSDATSQQGAHDVGAVAFVPKSELSCASLNLLLHTG